MEAMDASYHAVMRDPSSLLRPWAMDPERDRTLTCPSCLGVADYWDEEQAFVCRRCGARQAAEGMQFLSDLNRAPGARQPRQAGAARRGTRA